MYQSKFISYISETKNRQENKKQVLRIVNNKNSRKSNAANQYWKYTKNIEKAILIQVYIVE